MIRKIIKIDKENCNGCGLCVNACHEGAISLIGGKAVLTRDDYCDGLGNCLPVCPAGAIAFEEREAEAFNKEAVNFNKTMKYNSAENELQSSHNCGCPSSSSMIFDRKSIVKGDNFMTKITVSELRQFPIQLQLVSAKAPFFESCNLLIAADCTAFAYGMFHEDFIKGKITLIACPKLDKYDNAAKLTDIIKLNNILTVTVVRMEVPCCGGITDSVKKALGDSGKVIPWNIITITRDGSILH